MDSPATFNVLAGSSDDDGSIDPTSVVLVAGPAHGIAEVGAGGTVTYTPAAGYVGGDQLTYRVKDDRGDVSNVATLAVTVNAVSVGAPPVVMAGAYPMAMGKATSIAATSGVLVGASDPAGRALTAMVVDGPAHGVLNLQGDGSFVYTPDPGFQGTDVFHYKASDGTSESDVAAVTLTVLPAPQVTGVIYNDGSAQRSMVKQITVDFNEPVTLEPGAIEVDAQGGAAVGLNLATTVVDGKTVAVVTFNGPGIIGGSVADGEYTLTVHHDLVIDGAGQALDGEGHGALNGDYVDAFFRLFGDLQGDGTVDNMDYFGLRSAYGKSAGDAGYNPALDYDSSGVIDMTDLNEFAGRRGKRLGA
jgi:hypothetical protein